MSTPAQIAANQANSQKSTGPTTPEGKLTSSLNRKTHGLSYVGGFFQVLPCEDQTDFTRLVVSFMQEYHPETATEQLLIQNMAQSQWLRDRALRLQERCFNYETGAINDAKQFSLYQRYFTTHSRAFHKCLADLLKQRKEKQNQQIGFEREKRAEAVHRMRELRHEMEFEAHDSRQIDPLIEAYLAKGRQEREESTAANEKAAA